jgi:ATP-dependent Clp endopeptidase proteolytic subunit ClpP
MSKRFTRDEVDRLHDYGIHVPTRTIYIGSEGSDENGENGVDFLMAERAIKNLYLLDAASQEPITIILNNPGGDVFHGMAIYDAIRSCRSEVTVKATGYVMSMASLILQAGDERLLSPYSVVMIHHGSDAQEGHVKKIRSWVEFGKRYDSILNKIYLQKIQEKDPGFSQKKLDKLLDFDTLLLAQEAVDLGLADGIYGEEKEIEED